MFGWMDRENEGELPARKELNYQARRKVQPLKINRLPKVNLNLIPTMYPFAGYSRQISSLSAVTRFFVRKLSLRSKVSEKRCFVVQEFRPDSLNRKSAVDWSVVSVEWVKIDLGFHSVLHWNYFTFEVIT